MASRLYPTTRRLFRQVLRALKLFGLGACVSPLVFALMAVYITGLLLLDRRQNRTRIADWLPGASFTKVDYSTARGRSLFANHKLRLLPAVLIGSALILMGGQEIQTLFQLPGLSIAIPVAQVSFVLAGLTGAWLLWSIIRTKGM